MAIPRVIPLLLIAVIPKCRCEATNGYNNYNSNDDFHFGQLLKPPPPPPLPILPVPFNGGKLQNQNDFGYQYQSPPPLPSTTPPVIPLKDFKFPAPFYRQYSFNFVPPPQPFATTPSPSMFQKISGWLFPSQQTSSDLQSQVNNNHNTAPLKGNCNPCNLVPWIPVIRYDLAPTKGRQNALPTYGPPSPTATTNFNSAHNLPQPFAPSQNNNYNPSIKLSTGIPHASYGPPPASQISTSSFNPPSSTYGPPSPTHIVSTSNQAPLNSPYSISSSTFYDLPNTSLEPSSSYGLPSSPYRVPDSTYKSSLSSYGTPSTAYENHFSSTTYSPISTGYKPEILNHYLPTQNDVEILSELEPSSELQLPKVTHPTGFRNSYGEPILNTYALDIPFSVSAAGAASSKIKTEILPENRVKSHRPNMTIELANPAPFSLNRGRNIHTLQPVALPNLSVSPLPPIFNARPFRVITSTYPFHNNAPVTGPNNFNIAKSVPVAEYTHSVEYPTTIIQSPVIDIDELKAFNHTKGYRNIQNSYVIDGIRDISPQASEDHISAAKSNQDVSFESIGTDFTNDLYDSNIPMDLKQPSNVPFNHKVSFADLRGVKDEDVDKYRTESNLQHIDSPLLYLKPSAPHKNYNNFFFMVTTPGKQQEYEIYDDIPTTTESTQATLTSGWDESRKYFTEHSSSPTGEEKDRPKIVQIIVPYTTAQRSDHNRDNIFNTHQKDSISSAEQKYQARKIQSNTENIFVTIATEGYSTLKTTTEEPLPSNTENYDLDRLKTPIDFYEVKEPPFDIVKLQHTIDDWTEQEYSKDYSTPQRTRSNGKYAKQIPDEFLTTISPFTINYPTEMNYYNFDLYDHEGASSMHHIVTDNKTNVNSIKRKEYNTIERLKSNYNSGKNEEVDDIKKLHIYTAASTFRSTTTTTPAPWGQIQTSISPLTNEKIYVVTSKPWREKNESREYDYELNQFESNDTTSDGDDSEFDNLPFKSPRFTNRPSYGFTADALESIRLDSPYGFSRGWHRRINNLEYPTSADKGSSEEDVEKDSKTQRNKDENN